MMSMKSEIFFYILCGRGDYYTTYTTIIIESLVDLAFLQ